VWRYQDGTEMEMRGDFREVEAPTRIVHTERWGDEWPETLHTVLFAEQDGTTTVTRIVRFPSAQARDAALATGMMSGVERSFELLDALLAGVG
jgi:uncharacterized protein YndB with AHSA1/START domain